jgi:phage gp45-like
VVSLTDLSGTTRIAVANVFGYYRFADLNAGETYVFSVSAKRLKFTPQTQARVIVEDTYDINFSSEK